MATMLSTSSWTTFQVRSGSSTVYVGVEIIVISQDPTTAKSTIRVRPYLLKTGGSGAYQYNDKTSTFVFAGSSQSVTTDYDMSGQSNNVKFFLKNNALPYRRVSGSGTAYSNVPLGNEGTYWGLDYIIQHNSDGTATDIEFTITWKIDNTAAVKDVTQTGTFDLPTIPMASVLDPISSFSIDDTINVSYTQYVSSYTQRLEISTQGYTVRSAFAVTASPASITFTQSEKDILLAHATSPQIPVTFTLKTYTNSSYTTQVGIASEVETFALTLSSVVLDSYHEIRDNSRKVTGYHYGINGLVDTSLLAGLQVFGALYLNGGRIYSEYTLFTSIHGGDAGNIECNDTISDYHDIEIFACDNNGLVGVSLKVLNPTEGMKLSLSQIEAGSSTFIRRTGYTISGTHLNITSTSNMGYVQISGSTVSTSKGTNYLRILKVIGHK